MVYRLGNYALLRTQTLHRVEQDHVSRQGNGLSRPPTRVGANAALSFGYTVAISAVLGISRIAIHNPATCMFRLTSSSSHIPARRATSPAEGNSRAIAGHNRTIPRTRQHIKPRPGGFIAIHRALCCISFVSMIRALPCIYRSKRKPCRFACTATALAFTPSSIALPQSGR